VAASGPEPEPAWAAGGLPPSGAAALGGAASAVTELSVGPSSTLTAVGVGWDFQTTSETLITKITATVVATATIRRARSRRPPARRTVSGLTRWRERPSSTWGNEPVNELAAQAGDSWGADETRCFCIVADFMRSGMPRYEPERSGCAAALMTRCNALKYR